MYAKKNYDKYLSALKNSGLVSMEEKAQGVTADVGVGAEGGAGAMVLLGRTAFTHYHHCYLCQRCNAFLTVSLFFLWVIESIQH